MGGIVMTRIILILAFLSFSIRPASALTFNFDQFINGHNLTPTTSFGTVTFNQLGGDVEVVVDLANSNSRIQSFYLNYNDLKFSTTDTFSFLSGTSLLVDENDVKAGGYPGFFDIQAPARGNLGNISTFSAILHNTLQDLTVEDFSQLETLGALYAAVHIGEINESGDSIWVGADNGSTSVPEPGTVLLVGAGLLAVGIYSRRHQKV
jgi:hypothetical protein